MLFSDGSQNSSGTTIMIHNKVSCTVLCTVPNPLGCFIISKVQVDDKVHVYVPVCIVYVLVNIYAPNKKTQLNSFRNCILCFKLKIQILRRILLLQAKNPTLDKRGGIIIPRKLVVNSTECLQSELDLVDIFNVSHLFVSCLLAIPFDHLVAGLKVNDQLVAYATRFLAVRLKKCVVAPPRLKSQSIV